MAEEKVFLRNVIGAYMAKLGKKNDKVVVVNADLMGTCRNKSFVEEFPKRSFNVGIAEQDMVSFAAGLAHEGFIPYAFTMAPFMSMRACEQVRTDVAYARLPVRLMATYAGLSGGISLLGCAASMLASVLYAIFYYSTFNANLSGALLVASSGFAGCLIDSVLGGTIQVHYLDEKSGKLTEKEIDENGKKRRAVRGIKFFDNDIVNLTSNIFSALLALSIGLLLHI